MNIVFINQVSKTARMPRAVIRGLANRTQRLFKSQTSKRLVSVVFVGPSTSKKLNNKYRSKKCATNVLSFVSPEKRELGDIVICPALAKKEADSIGVGFSWWIGYLFIHGMLHLLDFDHKTSKQEEKMENMAKRILN
jgi:probable rRNA maturation factor